MRKTEKKKRFFNIVVGIFAAITLLNYTVYLVHLIAYPEQPLAFIVTIAVIAAVALPVIFRKQIKNVLKRTYPFFKAVWGAGLAVYVVSFAVMVGVIFSSSAGEVPPSEMSDDTVIILFGAKVGGTEDDPAPGLFLRRRLERCAVIMKEAPRTVCIVCGGKGANEPASEASVMKSYLIARGVSPSRIFSEDASSDTAENIENAKAIIRREGLEDYKVACLSTGFHIPRIKLLCRRADLGVDYYFSAASPSAFGLWSCLVREYMSYWKMALSGKLL
ncbi:MAG: YdcF family protein [Clostridia bacterium]|nr:YdcF family protein [Clostridia bacterium]